MTKRSRSGWTLIELLIVIAVIALLMGILFAVYMRGRGSARTTICINNLRSISQAMAQFREDNNGSYPALYNSITGEGGVSQLVIDRYVTDSSSLRCPLDEITVDNYVDMLHPTMAAADKEKWYPTGQDLFRKRYSSYNEYALLVYPDPTNAPSVYNGGIFGVGGGDESPYLPVPPGTTIGGPYRLYNYWGYNYTLDDLAQSGQSFDDVASAAAVYSPPDGSSTSTPLYVDPADTDPNLVLWVKDSGSSNGKPSVHFPGLKNPNAPANTVITHCPFHRQPGGGATRQTDIVARVGGSAEGLDAYAYDWIRQPR